MATLNRRYINAKDLAGRKDVLAAVRRVAEARAAEARALAAPHNKTGHFIAGIEVKIQRKRRGYNIWFNDRDSISINYGHWWPSRRRRWRYVEGLHIIEKILH